MQCFPDWWEFSGTTRHPIRQVGNAVPSLLGGAVGRAILKDIFSESPRSYYEIINLLDQTHLFSSSELELLKAFDLYDKQVHPNLAKPELTTCL